MYKIKLNKYGYDNYYNSAIYHVKEDDFYRADNKKEAIDLARYYISHDTRGTIISATVYNQSGKQVAHFNAY